MAKKIILGVQVYGRYEHVPNLQQIYTDYGCYIRTRLGLHDVSENVCSRNGVHLLEMFGDDAKIQEFEDKLRGLEGIAVQKMVFEE
jgi:metal-responsive CopG/Arc/MetJ family transcriptional regulator